MKNENEVVGMVESMLHGSATMAEASSAIAWANKRPIVEGKAGHSGNQG